MMATGQNAKGLTPEKLQKAIAKQEAAIKKKYDPSNFFRVNQNIEPAV